jgi:CubicO group peptidase (beta-lactamase class C family)
MDESRYSSNQKTAIITLFITTLLGLALLWFNISTPSGASVDEIIYLITVTVALLVLVPLYLTKISWSWSAGIVSYLGMYLGPVVTAFEGAYVFSFTVYNVIVICFYVVTTVGLLFSIMSLREQPRKQVKKTLMGMTGMILVIAVLFSFVLPSYSFRISWYMGEAAIGNINQPIEDINGFEEKIDHLVNNERVPSFVAGIVVDDELIWNRGWGASSEDTIYAINSMTKTFTATSVLQLYERSLLNLDDDVNDYLSFSLRHPEYPETPITIRMLLTHQSGLNHRTDNFDDYTFTEEFLDLMIEEGFRPVNIELKGIPKEEFFSELVEYEGEFFTYDVWTPNKPGTEYSYSNIGFDILTLVVETVTGKEYSDYLQENILDPLGMTSTVFSIHEFPERQAVPYERLYGVFSKTMMELPLYGRRMFGAGGLRSTVKDISRFMIALMNDGTFGEFQMLKPETVFLMKSVQVEVPLGHGDALQVRNGLGLCLLSEEPVRYWNHEYDLHGAMGHGGSNPGMSSYMYFAEDLNGSYGIITMTNHKQTYKQDNGVYTISVMYTIYEILMEEAYKRYLTPEIRLEM